MNFTLGKLFGSKVKDEFANLEFPSHLATDSRDVIQGGAFIALEGEKTDGHKYIPQAVQNGAALLIVRTGKAPEGVSVPVIELDEPERDLAKIASDKLKSHELREIVAITGSVGKTTTRAALQKVLTPHFKVHAPERSFNTLIGCTATIMAMPIETEIVILEFGANKPGEIEELTEYFPPSFAILTAVAPVHLEGFVSVRGVLNEKLEITHSPIINRIIFNNDNELLSEAFKYVVKSMGVGERKYSDYVISHDTSEYTLPAMSFVLAHRESQEIARLTVNIWGKHNAIPLSIAAAAGRELGVPLQDCADSLSDFQTLPGRGRVIFVDEDKFIVDDSYNANPASMTASLNTFVKVKTSGKIAVLGEMRELGDNAAKYHEDLKLLLDEVDCAILVGGIWHEVLKDDPHYIYCDTWQTALEELHKIMNSQEWHGILVKGSNSLGLSNIVKDITA